MALFQPAGKDNPKGMALNTNFRLPFFLCHKKTTKAIGFWSLLLIFQFHRLTYTMQFKLYVVLAVLFSLRFFSATAGNGTGQGNSTNTFNNLKAWDKTLMVRIKPEYRSQVAANRFDHPMALATFNQLGVSSFKANFPHRHVPERAFSPLGEKIPDMTMIYRLHYQSETTLKEAIRVLMNTGLFEYAEPRYIRYTTFVPNDPQASQQYHLQSVHAYEAWDITQGDTNVVVGIIDSGVQWTHPDLKGNIKVNQSETINGLDDDGDGKIDNIRGWDFCGPTFMVDYVGDNDPNITQGNASHGTHVAGISAAKTNNGVGVAGAGFKCKIMPLKCAPDDGGGGIYFGYEAIEYAASHGASVANCSWGGEGGYSTFEQETITDAALTFGCLVVAAAGNDNSNANFYPAYYEHTLSVAATGVGNAHANFTNYNYAVRVAAPGVNILSTYYNNTYQLNSGTSMASPVAAGVAALVKSAFPTFTPDQIAQRMRVTADNIYTTAGNTNPNFYGKYGRGIVNAFRAVSTEQTPGIKVLNYTITDGNNDTWQPGDSISISGNFVNLLQASSPDLKVKFTIIGSNSGYVIANASTSEYVLGEIQPNATKNMNDRPFKFYIKPTTPSDKDIDIRVYFSDGAYYDYDHITLKLNPSYINVEKNNISTTITSKGRIGYNSDGATDGLGFKHKRRQTTFEMGLISGTSATKLANTLRPATTTAGAAYDNDYRSIQVVREVTPPMVANFEYSNIMTDANATGSASNIRITQKTMVWTTPADSNYVMVDFKVQNTGTAPLTNFHLGIFSDFDISQSGQQDRADYFPAQKLGYIHNTLPGGLFAGISLLGNANPNFYAIENDGTGTIDFGVYDGYTDAEKFASISSGLIQTTAGATTPKDVSMAMGAGPYTLAAQDTIHIMFALVAGEDTFQIKQAAQTAQDQYTEITGIAKSEVADQAIKVFPNPAKSEIYISAELRNNQAELINYLGQSTSVNLESVGLNLWKADIRALPAGIYTIKLSNGKSQKMVIQ